MCIKGYLVLSDLDDDTGVYAIPVENFPILPAHSTVQLTLGSYEFEDLSITYYTANSTYGTLIFTREIDFNHPAPGAPNRTELQQLFIPFPGSQFDYTYPETIRFG